MHVYMACMDAMRVMINHLTSTDTTGDVKAGRNLPALILKSSEIEDSAMITVLIKLLL